MSDAYCPATTGDDELQLQEKILEDFDRLGPDDTFKFGCHPGISCFNCCCSDVNIFLSPYDVLRLKKRLGLTSGEFLNRYALLPVQKEMKTPVVLLRMNDDELKTCPMLGSGGCSVYTDRPWPCRMYPLGLAAQRDTPDGWRGDRFYFLMKEEGCKGYEESTEWTVKEWLDDQGMDAYDEWGEAFKELTLHRFFEEGGILTEKKLEMFFTATYDLDKFRDFVFESTLLQRYDVDEDFVEDMRRDDEALLRFGFLWLRFALFGEPTMKARPEVLEAFQGSVDKKELFEKGQVDAQGGSP
jgi:Fe-S-cluster containining protein